MALPEALDGKLRIPLIGAPMFIVSGPELVIAQCQAGIVGSFPALNARPQSQLAEWIVRIKDELQQYRELHPDEPVAPFAVNQIVHASNSRLQEDLETCVEHEVPIIITSLRPPEDVVAAVHDYGGLVFHDVISLRHARKAAEQGVDGIIAVCAGAGGHAGPLNPLALVKEIRREFSGAIILSGCITSGTDVLAARAMGADLAYSGTRFIATHEANAKNYEATITRTEYGVPHIVAEDWGSLGYGHGYAFARDGFCQLLEDIIRANGRSVSQLARAAASCQAGGVGRYSGSNFVHVDCGQVRSCGR